MLLLSALLSNKMLNIGAVAAVLLCANLIPVDRGEDAGDYMKYYENVLDNCALIACCVVI